MMLQPYLLGTYQTTFCTSMMRNENPTPRAALVDSKLSRSSPCLSSPRLASSNTARRQSANAGDGQFEKLVLVKLTAAMAQREMDNSDSNEEREHVDLNFSSLLDAYDRLHTKIIQNPAIGNFNKAANYLDTIEFLDEEGNYQPITNVMVW